MGRLRRNSNPIMEEQLMNKTTSTLIAAAAALALSGAAYAQNNTLATPSVVSPAANATSGTGTTSPNRSANTGSNNSATAGTPAFGVNNTLARPSVASPVPQ